MPAGARVPAAGKPWIVPVCVAFERGGKRAETCSLLDATVGSIALDAPSCPRWVMPNLDGRGYYRVAYTAAQIGGLRDAAWPQLRPTERSALWFDVASAALLGKQPLALALSFQPRLLAAGDRFSIHAALQIPIDVRPLVPDELRPSYEALLRRAFGGAARKAGLVPRDGDGLDAEQARGRLIDAVGNVGRDPALLGGAVKLAERWRDLPPAIRGQVIALAAHASPPVFDRLLGEVYAEPDRQRRGEILEALATTLDVERQRTALALMFDPKLDIRDTQFMVFGANVEANRVVAQQFVKDHKDALLQRLPSDSATSSQAWLAGVFTASCAAERRDEIADYVTRTFAAMSGGARIVRQAIEAMDQCIARRRLIEPELRAWLTAAPKPRT